MSIVETIEQLKVKLQDLATIDFGYPLGENIVRPAVSGELRKVSLAAAGECGDRWLSSLYSNCDGLSFPDVHVGYFLEPVNRLGPAGRSTSLHTLVLEREVPVLPFGSTGGGGLFVIDCENGNVKFLPPGELREGIYDGRGRNVRSIAQSVPQFLELLLADLEAFIRDHHEHVYMTSV